MRRGSSTHGTGTGVYTAAGRGTMATMSDAEDRRDETRDPVGPGHRYVRPITIAGITVALALLAWGLLKAANLF